jgi:hypothetical protein
MIDADLRNRLLNLNQPLELIDEAGRVVARVLPTLDPALYEDLEPRLSAEELQRRRQRTSRTYTTAEVLSHLEKM